MKIERVKLIQDFSQGKIQEVIRISCCRAKMEVCNNKLDIQVSQYRRIVVKIKIKTKIEIIIALNNSNNR